MSAAEGGRGGKPLLTYHCSNKTKTIEIADIGGGGGSKVGKSCWHDMWTFPYVISNNLTRVNLFEKGSSVLVQLVLNQFNGIFLPLHKETNDEITRRSNTCPWWLSSLKVGSDSFSINNNSERIYDIVLQNYWNVWTLCTSSIVGTCIIQLSATNLRHWHIDK